jgi:hypothetical protein
VSLIEKKVLVNVLIDILEQIVKPHQHQIIVLPDNIQIEQLVQTYLLDITALLETLNSINVHDIVNLIEKKVLASVLIDILDQIVKIHQHHKSLHVIRVSLLVHQKEKY